MKKPKPELTQAELRRAAVELLSRRDYSRRELARKLSPQAADPDDVAAVLDDLAERHWQSDKRFAESFLNSRCLRYGPLRIQQELREKGLNAEQIQDAFANISVDWYELALEFVRRKCVSGLSSQDIRERARLYRFLAYRGFNRDHIDYALAQLEASCLPESPEF
ncbi:MAG: recombination regulator RecX [Saccharospirillaceae bacterium]|nr:recombination regulator RecX [Saccharospirillaceae bacterium]MCD8532836.1 recombination regulator RecX [Saccharospirillaceae bacterium]